MTYKTYTTNGTCGAGLIPKHGGYRGLKSYQTTEIIYDGTVGFCKEWIKSWKLREQMKGAARSGKQNIGTLQGLALLSKARP